MSRSSRRTFLGSAAAAAAAIGTSPGELAVSAQAARSGGAAPPPDLRLINGRIHTMDARNAVVSSVAITNGRITAVGGSNPGSGARTRGPSTCAAARSSPA